MNGPFSTFSSKLDIAFCAGWIDSDVYHDANAIRKLRNECAHRVDSVSLDTEEIRALLNALKVPDRRFSDWGEIRVAAIPDGVVFFKGDMPDEATEELCLPGAFLLRMALPLVLTVLAANLGIAFHDDGSGTGQRIILDESATLAEQGSGKGNGAQE